MLSKYANQHKILKIKKKYVNRMKKEGGSVANVESAPKFNEPIKLKSKYQNIEGFKKQRTTPI